MATQTQISEEFHRIAPAMESMQRHFDATVSYHLPADAIYWSDEIPASLSRFGENCLRPVLHYRTSMILGKPEDRWREYWDEATQRFPNWIGFCVERTRCNPELQETIAGFRRRSRSA